MSGEKEHLDTESHGPVEIPVQPGSSIVKVPSGVCLSMSRKSSSGEFQINVAKYKLKLNSNAVF